MNPTPHREDLVTSQALPTSQKNSNFHFSVCSFTGAGHGINQDSHAFRDGFAYVLADGVGGGAWGEIASASLCSQLVALDHVNERLVDLAFANADVSIASKLQELGSGPGAAVGIGLWPCANSSHEWLVSWVGDCRMMHLQPVTGQWKKKWLSIDQTYLNLKLNPPDGVRGGSPANMVGCGMGFPVSHQRLQWSEGERMVMASDGFWGSVDLSVLDDYFSHDLHSFSVNIASKLCHLAQSRGSQDDITVMVIERTTN
jgi:serine/threonine protein phosphatase PrpC